MRERERERERDLESVCVRGGARRGDACLMMIVLFQIIVLLQNQTSNTFGEGTYSTI